MTVAVPAEPQAGHAEAAIKWILSSGLEGRGPMKGARQVAEEHLAQHHDPEKAIAKLIRTHTRMVGTTGLVTGLGGLTTLAVTVPADLMTFYAMAARCAGAIAHIRGYDIDSDEVRSLILISLLGAAGVGILADVGVQAGNKAALAALKKLPGKVLTKINQKVGFRLFTKFGEKGVVNLVKVVPLVGGGVGATVNVAALRTIGQYAKLNFPPS